MTSQPNKFVSIGARDNGGDATDDYFVGEYHHLPASRERKQNLLTYAQHNTKSDNIKLHLSEDADTASIQNYEDENGSVIITIPVGLDIDNPYAGLGDEEFYSMLQYAWVLHETGHYLYTDQPTVNERLRAFEQKFSDYPQPMPKMLTQVGKRLWNAIEDGAMEEAIRNEKGPKSGQRLAVKNESFIAQPAKEYDIEERTNVDVLGATQAAAMDLAKYDTGTLRRLLDETDDSWEFRSDDDQEFFVDEILPLLHQGITDAFTAASSVNRQHVIWDLCEDIVERILDYEEIDPEEQPDTPFGQTGDDTENQSGAAQKQQSPGLQQNTKQQVAQRQANTTQQTVSIEMESDDAESGDGGDTDDDGEQDAGGDDESDAGGQSGDGEEQSGDDAESGNGEASGDADGESGVESGDESGDGESSDGEMGQTEHGAGGAGGSDEEIACPDCGSTDVSRETQTVDGMIAARVNAPFSLNASWIDSISFVSDDEVCGFRVETTGDVPTENIESQGYIVASVGNGTVEVLERADQYGDQEQVNGFNCDECGYSWVPVIGGGDQ